MEDTIDDLRQTNLSNVLDNTILVSDYEYLCPRKVRQNANRQTDILYMGKF